MQLDQWHRLQTMKLCPAVRPGDQFDAAGDLEVVKVVKQWWLAVVHYGWSVVSGGEELIWLINWVWRWCMVDIDGLKTASG